MTHNDIYIKYMIEYDKANVTSSYPSLTEYEVATVLDKAYNALIAQKVTGNNFRRVPFEADIKAISDLQPLVAIKDWGRSFSDSKYVKNQLDFKLPDDFLYYVGSYLNANLSATTGESKTVYPVDIDSSYTFSSGYSLQPNPLTPQSSPIGTTQYTRPSSAFVIDLNYESFDSIDFVYDGNVQHSTWYVGDVSTSNNVSNVRSVSSIKDLNNEVNNLHYKVIIWTDTPLLQNDALIYTLQKQTFTEGSPYDLEFDRQVPCQIVDYNTAQKFFTTMYNIPWIKNPVCYIHGDYIHVVKEDETRLKYKVQDFVLTYIKKPTTFVKDLETGEKNRNFFDDTPFELNNTMAEELISLAIAMTLENIESPRLNSKLNMRGLEA